MPRAGSTTQLRIIEWTYQFGPPRRSWKWYAVVLLTGLGLAGLFYVTRGSEWGAAGWMLVWLCLMLASALAPSRTYRARLDRNLLTVHDSKRDAPIVERNLAEFAIYAVEEIAADQLNPTVRMLILTPRDGRTSIQLTLTGDHDTDQQIVHRITAVVARAPDIAPTWLDRLDRFAQRVVGWR